MRLPPSAVPRLRRREPAGGRAPPPPKRQGGEPSSIVVVVEAAVPREVPRRLARVGGCLTPAAALSDGAKALRYLWLRSWSRGLAATGCGERGQLDVDTDWRFSLVPSLGRMCPPGVDQSGRFGPRLKSWHFVTIYGVTCLFCVVASPVLVPVWAVAALQGPVKRSWRETKEKRRRRRCEKQKQEFLEEDSD